MVELYVDGNRIGPWYEVEHLIAELTTKRVKIELRDDKGKTLASIVPAEPFRDQKELDRRRAEEGGMSLKEFWKKMGVELHTGSFGVLPH